MINWRQVLYYLNWVSAIALIFWISIAIFFSIDNEQELNLVALSYLGTIAGGVTSLIAIYLLYKTYESQRDELRATREALRLQKVDSAFFNMLSMLQELVKAMSDVFPINSGGEEKLEGRAYLKKALEQLHKVHLKQTRINMRPNCNIGQFNMFTPSIQVFLDEPHDEAKYPENVDYTNSDSYNILMAEVAKKYEEFYNEHQQNLGHYFRYIYNIIKYIIDPANRLVDQDRRRYLGILQAQLSNDELGLIFYNVLSKHGQTSKGKYRFLNWLDQYQMLENMDRQSLKHEWHHWFFPKTNFKFLDSKERERKKEYVANLTKFNIPK
jgi:hypothetical protein